MASKYRSVRASKIEEGSSFPITLTTASPYKNEHKKYGEWWRWMAELPPENPAKQGDYDSEYVYFDVGAKTLQGKLEHAVSQYGEQDGRRTRTAIVITRNGEKDWDVKATTGGSNGGSARRGNGGGNWAGDPTNASEVKQTADLLTLAVIYHQKSAADFGVELSDGAAAELAKFTVMQVMKAGHREEVYNLLAAACEVPALSRADLEGADGAEEGEDDEIPF